MRDARRPWLRRIEKTLWLVGLVLLGHVVATLSSARIYQTREARAVERGEQTDSSVLGIIEIPRIGVSAVVREGIDEKTLRLAVGHVPGTPRPGQRGNVGLAAHRDSFFRGLRNVRKRDRIVFHTPKRSYEYRVEFIEVVTPEATRVLASSSRNLLTLVTCYPFDFVGNAPKRYIVRASAVPPAPRGPEVLEARNEETRQGAARLDQGSSARAGAARAVP